MHLDQKLLRNTRQWVANGTLQVFRITIISLIIATCTVVIQYVRIISTGLPLCPVVDAVYLKGGGSVIISHKVWKFWSRELLASEVISVHVT